MKADKQSWLFNYIEKHGTATTADVQFRESYASAFYPPEKDYLGEKDVARQLSEMFKMGLLKRATMGISNKQSGTPNWAYIYEIDDRHAKQEFYCYKAPVDEFEPEVESFTVGKIYKGRLSPREERLELTDNQGYPVIYHSVGWKKYFRKNLT